MENSKTRIVAAIVDTEKATLYKPDGTTVIIKQGDPRLRRVVDESAPQIKAQGWADVDLSMPLESNDFLEFEAQTGGVVKLFRIAKDKLAQFFMQTGLASQIAEEVKPVGSVAVGEVPSAPIMATVDEIIAHAVPVSAQEYHEETIHKQANVVEESGVTPGRHTVSDAPDTIIAVVDGKVIPGVERIKTQFKHSVAKASTQGLENFLKRLGSVIDKRSHSVEDLLKFMERGDLPIADDGSILIYKVLRTHVSNKGEFRDCHTGQVPQWVGAYVCMDESLVDHNRNNECSNGLHVARRGYISSFCGDVCVLAKLAPEDVIAVPTYDANKMRVCGYHIIKELTYDQYRLLNQNKPITDDKDGGILLAEAIAGKHIHRTHEVRITAQRGGGVVTKPLEQAPVTPVVAEEEEFIAPVAALSNPDKPTQDAPVHLDDVLEKVDTAHKLSRQEQAKKLYEEFLSTPKHCNASALDALVQFKKAAKVSWDKLGIPDPTVETKKDKVDVPKADTRKINAIVNGEGSARVRIEKLLGFGFIDKKIAEAISTIKKESKKSWDYLGVDTDTQSAIQEMLAA